MLKINVRQVLKDLLVGRTFVDSEYAEKGNHKYYKENDLEYPPFDRKIVDVNVEYDGEDPVICLRFLDENNWSTYHNVYASEDITVE
jgi:hypothetical protein